MELKTEYNPEFFGAVWNRQKTLLMELVDKVHATERRVCYEVAKEAVRESCFHGWKMARRAEPRHNEDGVSRYRAYEQACRPQFSSYLPGMVKCYADDPERQKLFCLKILAIRKTSFVIGWRGMRDIINQLLEDEAQHGVEGKLTEVAQDAVDHWLKVELAEPDFG